MEKNISIADIVWSYITVDGKRDSDDVTRFISEVGPAFIKYEIMVEEICNPTFEEAEQVDREVNKFIRTRPDIDD
jgi:hypothetical protein